MYTMITRRIALLLVLISLLTLVGAAGAQDDTLTQTYTSPDGQLSLSYPAGWVFDEFIDQVYMMNDPAILDLIYSLTLTELSPGQVFISVATPSSMIEGGLNESADSNELLGYMITGSGGSGEPQEMTIGGHPGAKATVMLQNLPYTAYVWQPAEGVFHLMLMLTAPGEEALFEPTALAIAETVIYNPPAPIVEQGTIVWEVQQEALYEQTAPEEFYQLGAVAVAPDGTIFVADGENGIHVYSADGQFINEIVIAPPDGYLSIQDLVMAADGTLWIVDSNDTVQHLNADGTVIETFAAELEGSSSGPVEIEVSADGNLFLLYWLDDEEGYADQSRIHVLDSGGVLQTEFEAGLPTDGLADAIEIGPDGNLHVLNDGDVRVFDAAGNLVADPLHVLEYESYDFEVGADGMTYFKIAYGPIAAYDAAGNYLYQYGAPQEDDSLAIELGEIADVQGMAVLPNGDLIVADTNTDYTRLALLSFAGE